MIMIFHYSRIKTQAQIRSFFLFPSKVTIKQSKTNANLEFQQREAERKSERIIKLY